MMKLVITVMTLVTAAASLRCRTSVDARIRWTVDCGGMNLSSAPPPMIVHPIITLNVSHNWFRNLQESQFINWTDISILDLSFNSIQTIDKNSFKGLSNLTELYLNNNAIQVLSSNITEHLVKLKTLSIYFNKLKSIESSVFEMIPSLYKLYLGHNTELGSAQENFNPIKTILSRNLLTLGLENITLSEIPKDLFGKAENLIYLNLALNPLKNISGLPSSLRYLNISATLIESISKDSFRDLQLIQKLSVESMPYLKEIKANSFSGLNNIEELYLRNCSSLNFISENAFNESHLKLKKVILSYCGLETLSKMLKPVLSEVDYLDLQGNPWTCDSAITWILDMNLGNLTSELRCENPASAKGLLLVDFFKPRSLHHHTSLIRAGILVMLVAVLVASVVGMVKQASKQKAKTYRQLNNIKLEDRTPQTLPPL